MTITTVNPVVSTTSNRKPTAEELMARIAQLEAKLAESKGKQQLTLKVSEKGAVSLYGVGRWPVTLYASTWETVLSHGDAIRKFIADNQSKLSYKE